MAYLNITFVLSLILCVTIDPRKSKMRCDNTLILTYLLCCLFDRRLSFYLFLGLADVVYLVGFPTDFAPSNLLVNSLRSLTSCQNNYIELNECSDLPAFTCGGYYLHPLCVFLLLINLVTNFSAKLHGFGSRYVSLSAKDA